MILATATTLNYTQNLQYLHNSGYVTGKGNFSQGYSVVNFQGTYSHGIKTIWQGHHGGLSIRGTKM